MLNAHRLPPLTEGFIALAGHTELAPKLGELVSADLNDLESDPYASHPTLRQRLEALEEPVEQTMPSPLSSQRRRSKARSWPDGSRRAPCTLRHKASWATVRVSAGVARP
jgi:hypothetical protein